MMKKWLSLLLAALMLLALAPAVLAEGEGSDATEPGTNATEPGTNTTDPGTGTTDPGTGTTDPGTTDPGTTDPGSGTNDPGTGTTDPGTGSTEPGTGTTDPGSGTNDPGTGSTEPGTGTTEPGTGTTEPGTGTTDPGTGSTEPGTGGDDPAPVVTTLTAFGGTFPYDGKPHAVTYTLENGEEYKNVYFSVDGGNTWTKTAPSLTKAGKLTVTVRAVKDGGKDPLTVTVKLEVTSNASEGSTVTIVNCDSWVNVRAKASSNSTKLGTAKKGKVYQLLAVEGKWYKIQYTADKVGYVFHSYVKVGSGTAPEPTVTPDPSGTIGTIVNCNSWVNVRAKATSNSKKLGIAKKGATYTVTGVSGNWVQVNYDGKTAYIYKRYIKYSGTAPTPGTAPDPVTPVDGEKGYIFHCNSWVNVRQKASSNSKKLGTLKKGTEITITGISGKWTRFSYNGGTAYVFSYYVSNVKPDEDVVGKKATIVNCNAWVNVREKASSTSKKLGEAKKGATYTVKGLSGNWVQVDYNGKTAYIYKRYIKIG